MVAGGVAVVAAVGLASGLSLTTIGLSLVTVLALVASVAAYDAHITAQRTQAIR